MYKCNILYFSTFTYYIYSGFQHELLIILNKYKMYMYNIVVHLHVLHTYYILK